MILREMPLHGNAARVPARVPVMRQFAAQQNKVTSFKRTNVISDKPRSLAFAEKRQLHLRMEMPPRPLPRQLLHLFWCHDALHILQRARPPQHSKGMPARDLDLLTLDSHGHFHSTCIFICQDRLRR